MLIRYGYDISLNCEEQTPMVCLLSAHSENRSKMHRPETFLSTPVVNSSTYRDLYGNTCRRFMAPAGEINLWGDGVVEDNAALDRFVPEAQEGPLAQL